MIEKEEFENVIKTYQKCIDVHTDIIKLIDPNLIPVDKWKEMIQSLVYVSEICNVYTDVATHKMSKSIN